MHTSAPRRAKLDRAVNEIAASRITRMTGTKKIARICPSVSIQSNLPALQFPERIPSLTALTVDSGPNGSRIRQSNGNVRFGHSATPRHQRWGRAAENVQIEIRLLQLASARGVELRTLRTRRGGAANPDQADF